jgi:hypothetical protein
VMLALRFQDGPLVQPVDHATEGTAAGVLPKRLALPRRTVGTLALTSARTGARGVGLVRVDVSHLLVEAPREQGWWRRSPISAAGPAMLRAKVENARSRSAGSSDRARRAKRLGAKPWGGGREAQEKLDLPAGFG